MSTLTKQNLRITQGDDFLIWLDVPELEDGDVANAEIRRWAGGPALAQFTTLALPTALQVRLTLTATQTAALTRHGVWDLEIAGSSGARTVRGGNVVVRPQVTSRPSPHDPTPSNSLWGSAPWGLLPWEVE